MKTAQTVHDPVCGMTVDPETAAGHAEHEGKTYFFCSKGCQAKFEASPAKFLTNADTTAEAEPAEHGCCGGEAKQPDEHSCCGGAREEHEPVAPSVKAKYLCPMCAGVESD